MTRGYTQPFCQTSETNQYPPQSTPHDRANTQPSTCPQSAYATAPYTDTRPPQNSMQTGACTTGHRPSYYAPAPSVDGESAQSSTSYTEPNPSSKRSCQSKQQPSIKDADPSSKRSHQSKQQPSAKDADRSVKAKENRYKCQQCKNDFKRQADLSRHMKTIHQELLKHYTCDYKKCSYNSNRKDHYVEHLRDTHNENLPRRKKKQEIEESEEWWNGRTTSKNWWRCYECLKRVNINQNSWSCQACNIDCSASRIKRFNHKPYSKVQNTTSNPPYLDLEVQNSTSNQPSTTLEVQIPTTSHFTPVSHAPQYRQTIPVPCQPDHVLEANVQDKQSDEGEFICNECGEKYMHWNEAAGTYTCLLCYIAP